MSEYNYVEKPFLDQLRALGWEVIDQGEGIPTDPFVSLRTDFREVVLGDVFRQSVRAINTTDDGKPWLTDRQLEELLEDLTNQSDKTLIEANEILLNKLFLCKGVIDKNELTGDEWPDVKIIDFAHPEQNRFIAINQFRIDTPGRVKDHIRPDIVLFVNGLPLVVIECKDVNVFTANPMAEAIKQLHRYADKREETQQAGLKEGEERLFHFNQFVIGTYGDEAQFGTITSTEEHFFAWKDIYPEKYRQFTPPLGAIREQETLIQGMLAPETLLDIVRNCTIFKDTETARIKVVCRYQQYRAVLKMIERLRKGKSSQERSGVIWHTQGSGKSLTMVFVIRKLRRCEDLKDYKVLLVNDRIDLEEQLGDTAELAGEKVQYITSSQEVTEKLSGPESNLNMVMVHKFQEAEDKDTPDYLKRILDKNGKSVEAVPEFKIFDTVNISDRILIMVDEAHRTQSNSAGSLANNLFTAFPNATKVAFTGTPLITERHAQKTWERFGGYIDKYKLHDAVADDATVKILYEGKTADTAINEKHEFDRKFEDLFRDLTDEEMLAVKKKYGTSGDIFEAEKRIEAIAKDMVKHYIEDILPNGFKAQVVSSSKLAAVRYKTYIDKAIQEYLDKEMKKPQPDKECIRKIEFLKSAVVVSSEGTNERAEITVARKHAKEVNAVKNFKKSFDYDRPDTGLAFLIVCDMLLTGFDAPIEQVMYIDKKIKEHNLLQTIARVNRVHKGKKRGFIVDYIGLSHHLREALAIYSQEDVDDVQGSLEDIRSELPLLDNRYRQLVNLFVNHGVKRIEEFVTQQISDAQEDYHVLEQAIELLKDVKLRATFDVYLKKFLQSMDTILPHAYANNYLIQAKRFGYLHAKVRQRYKDESISISGAGGKIKKLINDHLISLGINPKIPPTELLDTDFLKDVHLNATAKAKASEMEHAIRKHCKLNFETDPAFYQRLSEKLDALIQKHREDWNQLCVELNKLRDEARTGRVQTEEGISVHEAPFYDLIGQIAFGKEGIPAGHKTKIQELVKKIIEKLQNTIDIINFWSNGFEISKLRGDLSDLMLLSNIDEVAEKADKIVTEVTALAKSREKDILG
jgi:type I restriction enzyme R subunit